jgi:hypothetical protein
MEVLADCENKLESALNDEGKKIFEIFNKSQIEIELLLGIDKFTSGLRLGALMGKHVFNANDDRSANILQWEQREEVYVDSGNPNITQLSKNNECEDEFI